MSMEQRKNGRYLMEDTNLITSIALVCGMRLMQYEKPFDLANWNMIRFPTRKVLRLRASKMRSGGKLVSIFQKTMIRTPMSLQYKRVRNKQTLKCEVKPILCIERK